jgi:hypothetical protein
MRRGRLWVGVLATALVALSGTVAQAAPVTGTTSTDDVRAPSVVAAADDAAGAMHALPARRVLDTRSGLGAAKGARSGGSTTTVTVLDHGGVPASGVGAVVLHVTVTGATGSGHVTAYPGGTALPNVSTLNVTAAQNITNMTVVPVGADGGVSLRYTGSGTVHLVADVAGWTTAGAPTEPGMTGTLAPARLMDTRTGLGGRTTALPSGGLVHLQVTGRGGVPASVGSVTLNVTAVTPSTGGWLAVTPVDPGAGKVKTSSLNFVAGQTIANSVTTGVSPTGSIDLRLSTGPKAHVVVDVLAWTAPGTPTASGSLAPNAPTRLLDTRTGSRPSTGSALEVTAGSTGGVVLNVTAVGAEARGYLTLSSSGAGTPAASQLSYLTGSARAAQVYVSGSTNGRIRITLPTSATHVVIDQVATLSGPVLSESDPLPIQQPLGSEGATGTQIGWAAPPPGTASIVVRRKTTGAPRSPFDGTQVFSGPGTTPMIKDTTAEPWHAYHYAVFARDALGNYSEAARTDATGAPLRFTTGLKASGFAGRPVDVSCPTSTWCLAVGEYGESWIWSGGAWSRSGTVDSTDSGSNLGFNAVSCPTTGFCLATLWNSRIATWHSGTWTVTATARSYGDVSCWSTTGCGLAVAYGGSSGSGLEFERWTAGSLSGGVAISGRNGAFSLSCPTSTCSFLTQTSTSIYVHRVPAGGSASTKYLGADYQGQLSCPTSTWCMAVVDGKYRTGYGTSWSAAKEAATTTGGPLFVTMDLSCPTKTSCTLVGIGGSAQGAGALRWNGSSWSLRDIGAGWNTERSVDCASAAACTTVDDRGRFTRWTGSSWTPRTTFAASRGGFSGLDCLTASNCVATDRYGNALEWSGGSSWPRRYVSEGLANVDCAGSTCMTVDHLEGTWRARKGGTWGATTPMSGGNYLSEAVLCATSSRCFSLAFDAFSTWNGSRWSSEPSAMPVDLGDPYVIDGDCPTSTFCLAFNKQTRASATWNGTRWTSRGKIPVESGGWVSADCISATFCLAKAYQTTAVLTGSGWHTSSSSPPAGGNVACRSTTHCILVSNSFLWTWDGSQWSETTQLFGEFTGDAEVTCVGTRRCVVASGEHIWWTQ